MNTKQKQFLDTAPGKSFNPDNQFGLQCKDLVDAYCLALWGDWVHTIRPGNAAVVFDQANPAYFTKIRNNPAQPDQIPQYGDIINWGWSHAVPEGHIAVVLSATRTTVRVLDMDGYAQRPARVSTYGYALPNGAIVVGWLRPKLAQDRPTQCVVERGDTLYTIAKQFGTTLAAMIKANPKLTNPNVIQPGQVLALP
jgi:hypothetical protein